MRRLLDTYRPFVHIIKFTEEHFVARNVLALLSLLGARSQFGDERETRFVYFIKVYFGESRNILKIETVDRCAQTELITADGCVTILQNR